MREGGTAPMFWLHISLTGPFVSSVLVLDFIVFWLKSQPYTSHHPQYRTSSEFSNYISIFLFVLPSCRKKSNINSKCNRSQIKGFRLPSRLTRGKDSSVCGFWAGWLCSIHYLPISQWDRPSGAFAHESATSQLLFTWGIESELLDWVFCVYVLVYLYLCEDHEETLKVWTVLNSEDILVGPYYFQRARDGGMLWASLHFCTASKNALQEVFPILNYSEEVFLDGENILANLSHGFCTVLQSKSSKVSMFWSVLISF